MKYKKYCFAVSMRSHIKSYPSGTQEHYESLAHDWYAFLHTSFPSCTCIALPSHSAMTKNIIEQHHVDMVILSGGDDMGVFPMRDQVEHELIQWAESKDIPLLGVCRGMQVINSYYGGSLHKLGSIHVASRHDLNATSVSHCCPQNVNSYHANGIMPEGLGSRLIPYAYAQDQSIEAVMHEEKAIVGIMWHPEREEHPSQCDINIITSLLEKKERHYE